VPDRITDRESLMRLLKVLGPRQRAVLVLRFYLDFSVEETAEILQITVGTVDTRFALVADSAESIEATARRLSESLDAALREAAPGAEWIFEPRIPGETGPDGQPMTMSHKECRLIRRPRGRIGMPLARGKGICKPNRPAVCGPSRTITRWVIPVAGRPRSFIWAVSRA
jgi:hypothetical protein